MPKIKLWIDDEREEPQGWLRVSNCPNAIAILRAYGPDIEAISFDHDIGLQGNGAYVAQHLLLDYEKYGIKRGIIFNIHSANPEGCGAIRKILEEYLRKSGDSAQIHNRKAAEMWQNDNINLMSEERESQVATDMTDAGQRATINRALDLMEKAAEEASKRKRIANVSLSADLNLGIGILRMDVTFDLHSDLYAEADLF